MPPMVGTSLRLFLVKTPIGRMNTPLFPGVQDIADRLSVLTGGRVKPNSAASLLSPGLNGQPLRGDVKELLIQVVEERLCEGDYEEEEHTWAMYQLMTLLDPGRGNSKLSEELKAAIDAATKLFGISPGFFDPDTGGAVVGRGDRLKLRVSNIIYLLQMIDPPEGSLMKPKDQLDILYEAESEAKITWRLMAQVLMGLQPLDAIGDPKFGTAREALEYLEQYNNARKIRAFVLEHPELVAVPTVVIDPDSDHASAWHIYINGAEQGPGYKVPQSYIRHWKKFYIRFQATIVATEAIKNGSLKEDVKLENSIFKYKEVKVTDIKEELEKILEELRFV